MTHQVAGMNHKGGRYADLELRYRAQIAGGLRDRGMSYRDISRKLGIPASRVESALGEANSLRSAGHSYAEIGRVIGLPRATVYDLFRDQRNSSSTRRKNTAVALLVDMSGLQYDLLAQFLGIGVNHTYVLVADLYKDRVVHQPKQVQPGAKWVYPTRETAEQLLGWKPKKWAPPLMYAEHYRAIAQARLMLVGPDPDRWVSERVLRHRAELAVDSRALRRMRPHVHDGRFLRWVRGERAWWALEVELSRKTVEAMDAALQGAIRAVRDSAQEPEPCVGLLYLCRSASVLDGVHAASGRLPKELADLDLQLVISDFDEEWQQYVKRRDASPKPSRRRVRSGRVS